MEQNQKDFDVSGILMFVFRWWKHLAIICFVAAAAAAIFSGPVFITPKFDATLTLFPATTTSLSRTVLAGPGIARDDFLQLGDVVAAERFMQVLGSSVVRDRIVDYYNLMEHYRIDPAGEYPQFLVQREFEQNVSFRRTAFGAIEITVRDENPLLAAQIANHLAALVDTIKNELRHQRALQAYEVSKANFELIQREIQNNLDSLQIIMEGGVTDILGQSGMLYRQLAIDLSAGNIQGAEAIKRRLELLGEKGGAYIFYTAEIQNLTNNLSHLQRRMFDAKTDLESFMTYKFVLDPAIAPDKKAYPIRWLIVAMVTFAAGFLALFTILAYEQFFPKKIPRQVS
ncbi:MAG TPA: hypothetical protein VLH37_08830 [Bacteroidales bacterium]|nr:hypothetical protein [Bacteroidales bacterium]